MAQSANQRLQSQRSQALWQMNLQSISPLTSTACWPGSGPRLETEGSLTLRPRVFAALLTLLVLFVLCSGWGGLPYPLTPPLPRYSDQAPSKAISPPINSAETQSSASTPPSPPSAPPSPSAPSQSPAPAAPASPSTSPGPHPCSPHESRSRTHSECPRR
jgi:hypothetical protein